MAVSAKLYAKAPANFIGGEVSGDGPMDLLSDSVKLTLHTSTYTIAQTTDEIFATATNELTTANGYTAGGTALASKTVAVSSLTTTFDAADVTWTATSITHRIAVLWDDTPTAPVDPLILYIDNGGNVTTSSTDLVYQFNASGIFTIVVA